MKNFVIVGGGTAGWMSAALLASLYPKSAITLIESSSIGTIGVGESTTPAILDFLNLCQIDIFDFIKKTDSTIKIGIKFENWSKSHYLHTFDVAARKDYWGIQYTLAAHQNRHPYEETIKLNQVPYNNNLKLVGTHALHINAIKLVDYLKSYLREKVSVKDALVVDVKLCDYGVQSIKLDDGQELIADLFIDCSGFKRVLHSHLNSRWHSVSKILPVNRAIPCPFDWNDPMNATHSTALKSGWVWQVPLTNRIGSGYVYSEEFCKDPEKEFKEFILKKYNRIIEPSRVIKFESGYVKNPWTKNVLCVGLSSGFLEPLESTSIHMIYHQITAFAQLYDGAINSNINNIYNNYMVDMFDDTVSFIHLHYMGGRTDTEFWKYMQTNKTTPKLENLLNLWKTNYPAADHIGQNSNVLVGYRLFALPAWIQVLYGTNMLNKDVLKKYIEFNELFDNKQQLTTYLTQKEFLDLI